MKKIDKGKIDKLARLAVIKGVNLQKGQSLLITAKYPLFIFTSSTFGSVGIGAVSNV